MIHFLTVHISPFWPNVQKRFLDKYVGKYKHYASVVPATKEFENLYDFSELRFKETKMYPECDHRGRLFLLADNAVTRFNVADEDLICFLDSDAFPISENFENFMQRHTERHTVVAVHRREVEESRPHISCLCMSAKTYKERIGLGLRKKYGVDYIKVTEHWVRARNRMMKELKWKKMWRTNVKSLYPTLFGVYGGVVYHHGAGSRMPRSKVFCKKGGKTFKELVILSEHVKSEIQTHDDFHIRMGFVEEK